MAELIKVNAPVRKPLFEGVQGENESRSIQFDITPWVEELGDGAVTATAKRSQDSQPYPVTVTKDGTTVTWKPTSTDTAFAGVGSFQLEYTVDSVLAKTCIWSTMVAPSLDPAGDPPDPYDNWLAEMREIAADAIQAAQDADASAQDAEAWAKGTKNGTPVPSTADQYQNNSKYFAEESYKNAEAWAVGQRGGVDVPSTDPAYENNAKYWAEQSLANQYGAFIVKSASGEIASFTDGGDDVPMKSVNVTITPKQSGSGDPSPSNVRPISGWTDADVNVDGKNMLPNALPSDAIAATLNSTTIGSASNARVFAIPCKSHTDYTFSVSQTGVGWTVAFGTKAPAVGDTIYERRVMTSTDSYTANSGECIFILVNPSSVSEFNSLLTNKAQIEVGSTRTAYEPYVAGHTTPVPLGQTVYGGELDVVSGVLTITHAMADLGSFVYTYRADVKFFYTELPAGVHAKNSGLHCICEKYRAVEGYNPNGGINDVTQNNVVSVGSSFQSYSSNLIVRDTTYTDATAFKTAVTGTKLVYELAVPTTVQLTPTQVATLLGTNNVWADCGSVAVEYRADPTLAYAELEALILENL